jgi:hypothetical protein
MFMSIASLALALQMGPPASIPPESEPLIQTVLVRPCIRRHAAMAGTSARATGFAIRTAICPRRIRPEGGIRSATIGAAAIRCRAGTAPTSIAGTVNATRPERSRANFRKGAVMAAADTMKVGAATTMRTEARARAAACHAWRSRARASATTATSEAMVYGFGSHPSGA